MLPRIYLFLAILANVNGAIAQPFISSRRFGDFFDEAYKLYPSIPHGILEGVAFANTGMFNVTHGPGDPVSCMGIPPTYGVMGLMEDGKGVFRNNLGLIADLAGYPPALIKSNTRINILAYAKAYAQLQIRPAFKSTNVQDQGSVIVELSELPRTSPDNYPQEYQLYAVYSFLNNADEQRIFQFPAYKIKLNAIFSNEELRLLQSPAIKAEPGRAPANNNGGDYSRAAWVPAPGCNYAQGRTQPITAIVIHDVEGSYQDCISWFKACPCPNGQCGHCPAGSRGCDEGVPVGPTSAHYVVSTLGQVTQMVRETDKAWHVGTENGYTIGIEHEGWCRSTYSQALYTASAMLVKDICSRKTNIDPKTTFKGQGCPCNTPGKCVQDKSFLIKGHQMYPNQTHTDPGPNWDWAAYYKLINT